MGSRDWGGRGVDHLFSSLVPLADVFHCLFSVGDACPLFLVISLFEVTRRCYADRHISDSRVLLYLIALGIRIEEYDAAACLI
ncbi:hypothetical protein LguiB_006215 [Lonicera macranthoides]